MQKAAMLLTSMLKAPSKSLHYSKDSSASYLTR